MQKHSSKRINWFKVARSFVLWGVITSGTVLATWTKACCIHRTNNRDWSGVTRPTRFVGVCRFPKNSVPSFFFFHTKREWRITSLQSRLLVRCTLQALVCVTHLSQSLLPPHRTKDRATLKDITKLSAGTTIWTDFIPTLLVNWVARWLLFPPFFSKKSLGGCSGNTLFLVSFINNRKFVQKCTNFSSIFARKQVKNWDSSGAKRHAETTTAVQGCYQTKHRRK